MIRFEKMSKEFDKLMSAHEECDRHYIESEEEVRMRIKDEFENAEEFVSYLEKDKKAATAFFDYSGVKPYAFSVIPVRKSDKLYVKKHTATQRPYYHSHEFYEIIFVPSGKCELYLYPDGDKIRIDKGNVCICAPKSVHALSRAGKKDVILKPVVPCNVFREVAGDLCVVENGVIKICENVNDKAYDYFLNFAMENGTDSSLANIAGKSWLILFIVELMKGKSGKGGDIVQKFDEYMKDNLKCATLTGFARFVGYNPDYVSRVLRRATGASYKENVTDIRLKKAKELLKNTDLSTDRVATETGYLNASGFYKQFTSTFGITPAQYRKSRQ